MQRAEEAREELMEKCKASGKAAAFEDKMAAAAPVKRAMKSTEFQKGLSLKSAAVLQSFFVYSQCYNYHDVVYLLLFLYL